MSTKQLGGQSTSRTKQLGSSKLNKQLNGQDTPNKELETPKSTPAISSITEVKIDKPQKKKWYQRKKDNIKILKK